MSSSYRFSHREKSILFTTDNVVFLDKGCLDLALQFVSPRTYALFGPIDVEEIINKSNLILGLKLEENNEIVAIMCLNKHPNVPAIPSWDWYDWFKNLYGIENVNSRNAFWMHLLVYDQKYTTIVMHPMARLIFRMKQVEYIFLVVPPGLIKVDFMDYCATRILPKGFLNPRTVQTLYMLIRQNYVKKYKIRRAVEEDNDDLVPLIDMYSEKLKQAYGEFYIAEILTRHADSGRHMIVAEYDSIAVAVVCLNENVNYDVLNEKFELVPYNGLRKPNKMDATPSENIKVVDDISPDATLIDDRTIMDSTTAASDTSILSSMSLDDTASTSESEYTLMFSMGSEDGPSEADSVLTDLDNTARKLGEYEEHLTQAHQYYEHHKGSSHDVTAARQEYLAHLTDTTIPSYYGSPNAFAMEIALAHPAHFAALAHLYEAAFECFPDRDFCVLSLPFNLTPPILHSFMFVPPRPEGTFPNSLYLLHRNCVVGQMAVRPSTKSDSKRIKALLSNLPKGQMLFSQYEGSLKSPWNPFVSYILTCDDQIIGMATLCEVTDINYLYSHYNLFKWMDPRFHRSGSHGLIENLVITPIFNKHGRYFLGELHRLSDFSVLYYKISANDTSIHRDRPLHNCLNYMVPIRSRFMPAYSMDYLKDYPPEEYVTRKEEPFALYLSLDSICNRRSFEYNTRIVIVGASDAAFGFLEALFLSQPKDKFVIFHNVTLVCSHALSRHKIPNKIRENLFIQTGFDSDNYMQTISPLTYVNIAFGVMTAINRRDRYITIDDVSYLPYDLLFLMCGEQFQKNSVRPDVEVKSEFPQNVYVINTATDGVSAFTSLKAIRQRKRGEKIIVYGHFMQAHCCIGTLTSYGIPGCQIIYVEPFPHNASFDGIFRHNVAFYNDPDVDEAVLEAISKLGVKVYQGYYFHDWVYHANVNTISHAKFESENQYIEIKCCAMFFYIGKSVSPRTFKSIIQAGLVFDGRLIIDSKCRTNDKHIYGAGTLTRYARHYDSDHLLHKFFNRKEIGFKLGRQIKDMLIKKVMVEHSFTPVAIEEKKTSSGTLVPLYTRPIVRYCRLPDGLYYLSVRKPGIWVPLEAALSRGDYGYVLVTGDCKNLQRQGYFRLHLNRFKKVETITCLTRFPIEVPNIVALYGRHEQLLNNLMTRFEMVLIRDLFDFFRQAWAYALYYDRFPKLWNELDEFMTEAETDDGQKYMHILEELYEERKWRKLESEKRDEVEGMFPGSNYDKQLEARMISFLEKNAPFLSMYGTPAKIKKILQLD